MPNNNSNSSNSKGSKKQKDLSDPHHDAGLPNKPGHTLYDPAANPFNLGRSVDDNEENDHAGPATGADNQNSAADATANAGGAADNDDEDEDDEPAIKRPYVFPPRTPPKKFLPHEILIAIRRVQAGLPVSELCRELGMSNSAFYKWRAKYNGMNDPLLLRMKRLQDHNDMLRKLYVDEKLRTETLQNALQACTHDKVAALKALDEARAQLEAYRNVTWTKKEPTRRTAPKAKAKGK